MPLPERVNVRSFNFTSRPALISTGPLFGPLVVRPPGARTRAAARPPRCVVSCGGVVSARAKWHAHRTIVGCTLLPTPTPMWKKHLRPAARFVLRRATHAQGEPSCRSGVFVRSGQAAPSLCVPYGVVSGWPRWEQVCLPVILRPCCPAHAPVPPRCVLGAARECGVRATTAQRQVLPLSAGRVRDRPPASGPSCQGPGLAVRWQWSGATRARGTSFVRGVSSARTCQQAQSAASRHSSP